MKNNEPQVKSFETSLDALEEIVHKLEEGDLPLEESLGLFEQGIRLSRECQERLSQAERRIEVLLRDQQGRPTVTPFEGDKQPGTEESETDQDENAF
jgi:exodeoxyribonuclease VII small subunit